jgi:hypothetical protein
MRFRWGRAAVTDRLSERPGITGAGITGPGISALMPELRPRRENLSRRENLNFFPGEAGNDFLTESIFRRGDSGQAIAKSPQTAQCWDGTTSPDTREFVPLSQCCPNLGRPLGSKGERRKTFGSERLSRRLTVD